MDLKIFIQLFVLWTLFSVRAGRSLSEEEDKELDGQLKHLNKPAFKSFKDFDGAVIDCVDINKQPSLDHPLLLNHTIQMKPSISSKKIERAGLGEESCPIGTIPIRRIGKEDLLRYKTFSKYVVPQPTFHNAHMKINDYYYGSRAHLNVWGLNVTQDQSSMSTLQIMNGDDSIQVGWMVNPNLFGDSHTRLYTRWTHSNSSGYGVVGCINLFCPGFVQVDNTIILGSPLRPLSVYNGPSYEMVMKVFRDPALGNWWLLYGPPEYETAVGYWPKSLFRFLDVGLFFAWGGEVISYGNAPSPPMGSGHFPEELYQRACYISGIQVVDDQNRLVKPRKYDIVQDKVECYKALDFENDYGRILYFGGPGNCAN